MLLKYFYDPALAHASYVVGCQQAKVAVVVDPGRDIEPYLAMADREGLRLTAAVETHIHADYVSGARELAERIGAKLYLSDEGPAAWKYLYASDYDAQLLKDGESFLIGKIRFDVMHTPGHTPESISLLLTDQGGGADQPMGIFTGDFVFVGAIGRPDLLEQAAGVEGSAEAGAHDLFRSVQRFQQLPDYLQLWPAHGAGSACGKGLGAIPSSTVGYEKRFNPALQFDDETAFVQYILSDQPEAPTYFAVMKKVNKEGPRVLAGQALPEILGIDQLAARDPAANLIDLSPSALFAEGHLPGAINIPLSVLASWAGWLVDYSQPVYLIAEPNQLAEAVRILRKIGLDQLSGVFAAAEIRDSGLATERYERLAPAELIDRIQSGQVALMDVRSDSEWDAGHIAKAEHRFLGRLPEQLSNFSTSKTIVTQCRSGVRSAIAASILQAAGKQVVDMAGGFQAWRDAGLPTESSDCSSETACQATAATKRPS